MDPQAVRRPAALRWFTVAMLALAVAMCALVAMASFGPAPLVSATMALAVAGLGWFAFALINTRATAVSFDGERLIDDAGEVVCTLEDVARVDRGFALWKPTNGFVLTLKQPAPRGWSPGLWWRLGRRVGIGGATPGKAGRNMADAISGALVMKDETFIAAMAEAEKIRRAREDAR